MRSVAATGSRALFLLLLSVAVGAGAQGTGSVEAGTPVPGVVAAGPQGAFAWPAPSGHVTAELISASSFIAPGSPLTVGILLRIDPEWHVYWRNPGQSGLPTTVDWVLPVGWSAKPLAWPVPERFETAGIVTYGYSNDVLLTSELLPPAGLATGTDVRLGARVTWLACRVECTPGAADLSLDLAARAGDPTADGRWAAAFAMSLAAVPAVDPAVRFTARWSGQTITLLAVGPAVRGGAAFYPYSQGIIDDAAVQEVTGSGESLGLTLKRAAGSKPPTRLEGLLVLGQGRGAPGLPVVAPLLSTGEAAGAGFLLAVVLALVGGLVLNLMPCVLPVLSLKVLSLVRNSHEDGSGSLRHGLYFSAGVIVSFLAIGGILVGLRAAGRLIGWGFQFQDPIVVVITAMLFFLIGLNLLGVFEIGPSLARMGSVAGSGGATPVLRSFLGGLFATAVATPCTAPFMGAALGYALSRPAPVALAVFAALGLGMSAPFLALSAFPKLVGRLPRPGRWMETLRQLMGFPMMAAVVWMLFVLSALSGSAALVAVSGALLAAGLGAWIWGRWGDASARRPVRLTAGAAALLLVAGAAAFSVVSATGTAAPTASARAGAAASSSWEPWSPGRVADLRGQGTPVFIDFTARWCLSCKVNEGIALENPEVQRRFRELGVATLRADWTDGSGEIATALESYGRAGVPLYVLYAPGAEEPVILPELITAGIVLSALDTLR